jgi:hypothetical protein
MHVLGGIGDSIAAAADAAAEAVTVAVDRVAAALGDPLEAAGNVLDDKLCGLGGRVFAWLGALLDAALQLIAVTVRSSANLLGNALGGVVRIVGGLLGGHGGLALRGLLHMAEALVGAVVAIAGNLVGLVQTIVLAQPPGRPLNAAERETLERVYRGTVRLGLVRLVLGRAGLFSLSDRPFTLANRIYMKKVDPARRIDILVHECCHVWQNQHEGTRYVGGAIIAQLTQKNDGAYDWQAERKTGKTWQEFNREAQAQFIEDLFRHGRRGSGAAGNGAFLAAEPVDADAVLRVGAEDFTAFARETVARLRAH